MSTSNGPRPSSSSPAAEAPSLLIRRARPAEYAAVGELVVRAYAALEDLGDYEAELRDVAHRNEHAEVFVAQLDGRLAGTITYVPGPGPYAEGEDPDAAWIRMLAVEPELRRRGVGEALVRACLERAQRDGRARVRLHTTERMDAAHRLYPRLGFRRAREMDWEAEPNFWLYGYAYEFGPEGDDQHRPPAEASARSTTAGVPASASTE